MKSLSAARHSSLELRWRKQHQFSPGRTQLPYWLLDESSLTDRLVVASRGAFKVVRLYQGWQNPRTSERLLLNIPPRNLALVREVQLECGGVPWVFARSVIPGLTCTGELRHLRALGNKSLGSILFDRPDLHRGPFEVARVAGNSPDVPRHLQHAAQSWARRSRFTLGGKALMVSELFLPYFEPWPAKAASRRHRR